MKFKIIIIILISISIALSGCLNSIHLFEGYTDANVTKKFIDVSREGSHYLLVTDKDVFEIGRNLLDVFNNSRNPDILYAKIIEGKRYHLHHYGYRLDFSYDYPIVVDAWEIDNETKQ